MNLDRRVIQLKIEREALRKEDDPASRERLARLEKELAELEDESNALTAAWQSEKEQVQETQKLKEQLDQALAATGGDRAAPRRPRARFGTALRRDTPRSNGSLTSSSDGKLRLVNEAVTEEQIMLGVVSRWTGIPVDSR